jgi:hypothetical protein
MIHKLKDCKKNPYAWWNQLCQENKDIVELFEYERYGKHQPSYDDDIALFIETLYKLCLLENNK